MTLLGSSNPAALVSILSASSLIDRRMESFLASCAYTPALAAVCVVCIRSSIYS